MTMQWGGLAQKVLGSQAGQQALGSLLGAVAGGVGKRVAARTNPDGTPMAGSRRGRTGTKTGMIAMPARLPNRRQFKKIQARLHDWRAISIAIINRTGGMNKPRRARAFGPPRRRRGGGRR
jgi:hypothetical protein